MKQNTPFKLFANCIPVKGFSRSIICDLQRSIYCFIPNSLFDILTNFKGESINYVKSHFKNEYDDILDEYFLFLLEKEFIFFTKETESFPKMSLNWETTSIITNSIISEKDIEHDYKNLINQLEELGVKAIQFRFFKLIDIQKIQQILAYTQNSRIEDIEIIIKYNKEISDFDYKMLYHKFPRLSRILIHSTEHDKNEFLDENQHFTLSFTSERLTNNDFCGVIHPSYFSINIQTYTEAIKFNSCLNRKVSIDENGEIKNCPSMKLSYGNIRDTSLNKVVSKANFKKYWNINKDKIEICKDCEFRYICTDCRAFIKKSDKVYSCPAKCTYNPYIAKWEGQEKYISVEDYFAEIEKIK